MLRRSPAVFLPLLVLVACSDGTPDRPDAGNSPPTPSLSIAPATAQLTSGGAPLTFAATLTGSSSPVAWTLTGPGSLSSTTGIVVAYTPPTELSDDAEATLVATGAGASASATIRLSRASGVLVAGRVVDLSGNPAPGIAIRIGTQSTVTDPEGRFALGNVSTPYTLTAVSVAQNVVLVYQGLTRRDPTVLWRRALTDFAHRGTATGTIAGTVPTSGGSTVVAWASPEVRAQGSVSGAGYSLNLAWNGPATTIGSVHVLQTSGDGPLPTAFPAYGVVRAVPVSDAQTISGVDVTLTAPAPSTVQGAYTIPPGYTLDFKAVGLGFDDGAVLFLGVDPDLAPGFRYAAPDGIGAGVILAAEATGPGGSTFRRELGVGPGSTNLSLALSAAAETVLPADGAIDVSTRTDFSWTVFPGAVYVVTLGARAPAPFYEIVTRDTHAFIPEVPELPLPGSTQYFWHVEALGPFESMDDVAGPRLFVTQGTALLESLSNSRSFGTR